MTVPGMTGEQAAERLRLMKEEGLTAAEASALVTEVQLDVPLGADGQPLVPPVGDEPISPPDPLLP